MDRYLPNQESIVMYKYFIDPESVRIKGTLDPDDYLIAALKYEVQIENYVIKVLKRLGILASVKTNRYSLPYKQEIIDSQTRVGINYNDYDLQQFVRLVVKELLELKVKKIRFYVLGDFIIEKDSSEIGYSNSTIVKFRYTIHDQFKD